jgi:hypothetical protein
MHKCRFALALWRISHSGDIFPAFLYTRLTALLTIVVPPSNATHRTSCYGRMKVLWKFRPPNHAPNPTRGYRRTALDRAFNQEAQ